MEIKAILNRIYELPAPSLDCLAAAVTEIAHPKGYHLLHADKVERDLYFVKRGIVRAYTDTPDNRITFWFGKQGDAVVSMRSYVAGRRGYETIELLEDSVLYRLDMTSLERLFATDLHIANWGRKFAEQELLKTEERLIARQFRTASERYGDLLRDDPQLVRRIQLSHIASYLGITQVSLSRIRAKFK